MAKARPYLLDADVFVQAKNLHYRFEFALAFWQWIEDAHEAGLVFSLQKVRSELVDASKKSDPVKAWALKMPKAFFADDVKDSKVMQEYGRVIGAVTAQKQYTLEAKKQFSRFEKADAFLIAASSAYGSVLITNEVPAPDSKSSVKIPDAAKLVGVRTDSIFNLLSKHAGRDFKFKP